MTRLQFTLASGGSPYDVLLREGGGGGKGGGAPAPIYTPPPAAPPAAEAATLATAQDAITKDAELAKKKSVTQGAKSLQIPLGSDANTTIGAIK
jgi:hypothetical protein